MVILVKVNCAKLEVLWEGTDVDLCDVLITTNNHIFDDDRGSASGSSLIDANIELLKPKTVFTAYA